LAGLEHNIGQVFADLTNRAVIRADFDPKSGDHIFRVSQVPDTEPFAESFIHSVSDIAINLQAALGQLIWQLALKFANGSDPPDRLGLNFPISETTNEWATRRGIFRTSKQVAPDHWAFIERFQPHHGAEDLPDNLDRDEIHPLQRIRDLANDKKHQFTQPVLVMPGQVDFVDFKVAPCETVRQEPPVGFIAWVAVPEGGEPTEVGPPAPGEPLAQGWFARDESGEVIPLYPAPQFTPNWIVSGTGQPIELGLEVMRARLVPPMEPEINPAGVTTPEVGLSDGWGAIGTLQRAHRFVHLMFSEFGREFPIL
jgi:hypothetical protein